MKKALFLQKDRIHMTSLFGNLFPSFPVNIDVSKLIIVFLNYIFKLTITETEMDRKYTLTKHFRMLSTLKFRLKSRKFISEKLNQIWLSSIQSISHLKSTVGWLNL